MNGTTGQLSGLTMTSLNAANESEPGGITQAQQVLIDLIAEGKIERISDIGSPFVRYVATPLAADLLVEWQ